MTLTDYETVYTQQRVPDVEPDLVTRFRRRAERRCARLNARLEFPFYHWEVIDLWLDGHDRRRWAVVAMQNLAVPK